MSLDDSKLIDLFTARNGVGLLCVRSARSSLTLRNAPQVPVADVAEPPMVDVMASAAGILHLQLPNGAEIVMDMTIRGGQELGWIDTCGRQTTINAPKSGTISAIDVANGEFVEFGQVLLQVLVKIQVEGKN